MSPRHTPWAEAAADFAIGLGPIPEADWLEGGEADPAARKDALMATHRDLVWAETPGSRAAQAQVLAMVEAATGRAAERPDLPPLYAASRLVADDLVLMQRSDAWRVGALSLSAPTFFSAEQVIGRSLAELHGPVPGFAERFGKRVERIFDGLRDGLVLQRRNWTLVNTDDLFTPRPAPIRARIGQIGPGEAGEALFLRVERQTLRRAPGGAGVVFTIRVWRDPLASLAGDAARLAAFAAAWRQATPAFRAYKGLAPYDALVEGFLRAAGE
ncbi:MAG: DUF3445 domain-containing protein [Caulobacteraceae bacterium]|jgi:hypothetical protein|nr:DUF3445 domain-containing protein [Caulobacteraceae bacterium]